MVDNELQKMVLEEVGNVKKKKMTKRGVGWWWWWWMLPLPNCRGGRGSKEGADDDKLQKKLVVLKKDCNVDKLQSEDGGQRQQ